MLELIETVDLENQTIDDLCELQDAIKTHLQERRAASKERVAELKAELGGLRQRRTKRTAAEPTDAEAKPRKSKKGKKRSRE